MPWVGGGPPPLFIVTAETLSTFLIDFASQLPSTWPGLLASPLCEDEPSRNEEGHRILQAAKTHPPPHLWGCCRSDMEVSGRWAPHLFLSRHASFCGVSQGTSSVCSSFSLVPDLVWLSHLSFSALQYRCPFSLGFMRGAESVDFFESKDIWVCLGGSVS